MFSFGTMEITWLFHSALWKPTRKCQGASTAAPFGSMESQRPDKQLEFCHSALWEPTRKRQRPIENSTLWLYGNHMAFSCGTMETHTKIPRSLESCTLRLYGIPTTGQTTRVLSFGTVETHTKTPTPNRKQHSLALWKPHGFFIRHYGNPHENPKEPRQLHPSTLWNPNDRTSNSSFVIRHDGNPHENANAQSKTAPSGSMETTWFFHSARWKSTLDTIESVSQSQTVCHTAPTLQCRSQLRLLWATLPRSTTHAPIQSALLCEVAHPLRIGHPSLDTAAHSGASSPLWTFL
jgi:hypothetical protein